MRRTVGSDPTNWKSVRCGDAVVTFGKPYYGKSKIIANAPLSVGDFDDLIDALTEARAVYVGADT